MTVNSSIEKNSSDQSKFLFVGTANLNKEYGVGKRSSAFDKNDLAKLGKFAKRYAQNKFVTPSGPYYLLRLVGPIICYA